MTAPLLSVEDLSAGYGKMPALRSITFSLQPGEICALLGANGAGKSTLLKTILGLVPSQGGRISFIGQSIERLAPDKRVRLGIGYAPEGRRIFPGMTVRETLAVACAAPRRERDRRITEIYALFPALAEKEKTNAWQLSGGQQQMLAIGRALIAGPRLLLLDEPSLGLAPILYRGLLASLRRIAATGTAVIFAEQNIAAALAVADRALVMRSGGVIADAPARSLSPEYVIERSFLGA